MSNKRSRRVGFVLGNAQGEFLRSAQVLSDGAVLVCWSATPHLARLFPSVWRAREVWKRDALWRASPWLDLVAVLDLGDAWSVEWLGEPLECWHEA